MAMHEDIVYFPPPPDGSLPPAIIETSGISYCDGSYRISRQRSTKYVFEYVVEGKGYINSPLGDFTPSAGDVYILHCDTSYTYGSSSDDPWTKIWFNARGRLIRDLIECYGLGNIWHIPNCNLEELFKTERAKIIAEPEKAHSMIGIIVHRIIEAVAENINAQKPSKVSAEGIKLKQFIDANLQEPLSLEAMAKHISKSVSQTVRIFRRDWHTTPYNYQLDKRIELAKSYLNDTAQPIKQIAADLHFADEYYFANMFKKKTGITPAAYRKS